LLCNTRRQFRQQVPYIMEQGGGYGGWAGAGLLGKAGALQATVENRDLFSEEGVAALGREQVQEFLNVPCRGHDRALMRCGLRLVHPRLAGSLAGVRAARYCKGCAAVQNTRVAG